MTKSKKVLEKVDKTTSPKTSPFLFPIAVLGGSAGSMEALEEIFDHMPSNCCVAFVVALHLQDIQTNSVPELLERHTSLPVSILNFEAILEPNRIFIVPPGFTVAFAQKKIVPIKHSSPEEKRAPISSVMRNVAAICLQDTCAIILSGGGSDGQEGAAAVRSAGGVVIAQKPESARYDQMPLSIINAKLADHIFAPKEVSEYFSRLMEETSPTHGPSPGYLLQRAIMLLRQRSGHDFSYYKHGTIIRRIERRMSTVSISKFEAYVDLLESSADESTKLFQDLLIGVTSFFRDPEAFNVLRKKVIPHLLENIPQGRAMRVWVPGCSSGEEAYSIAITLIEILEELGQKQRIQIFATDMDSVAIDRARLGNYSSEIEKFVSPARLERFFRKSDDGYSVKKEVRELIIFAVQSLTADPPFSHLDLVSCRNLLIYLGPELQKKIIPLFHYVLNSYGVLFLGASETVGRYSDLFSILDTRWKVYLRRSSEVLGSRLRSRIATQTFPPFPKVLRGLSLPASDRTAESLKQFMERQMLVRFSPSAVIINETGEILFTHGGTSRYLELSSGESKLNITTMAKEDIKIEIITGIHKVIKTHSEVIYDNLSVATDYGKKCVKLSLFPIPDEPLGPGLILVVFEEVQVKEVAAPLKSIKAQQDGRIVELESQLRMAKDYLQTTIEELETSNEELKSTNEELQSSNEELQSTNEELETSREELQSLNDELGNVNAELHNKVELLSMTNNDMTYLMSNMEVGTLFLNSNLIIKRINPHLIKMLYFIGDYVGRPISDLGSLSFYEGFFADIDEVKNTLLFQERTINFTDGRVMFIRILPYRTPNQMIDGVVITLKDLTTQTREHEQLRLFQESLKHLSHMVLITDLKGEIVFVNELFLATMGYRADQIIGWNVSMLNSGCLDPAYFFELWSTIKDGRQWKGIFKNKKANGDVVAEAVRIFPIMSENNMISHFVSVKDLLSEAT